LAPPARIAIDQCEHPRAVQLVAAGVEPVQVVAQKKVEAPAKAVVQPAVALGAGKIIENQSICSWASAVLGDRPAIKARRAASTLWCASAVLPAIAVRWPILRAGRGSCLPYKCSLTCGKAQAAAQSGSLSCHRSPNKLAMAAGRSSVVAPSGRPHTAR